MEAALESQFTVAGGTTHDVRRGQGARKEEAAEHDRPVVAGRAKGIEDEFANAGPQGRQFLRKTEHGGARQAVPLLVDPGDDLGVEGLHQLMEFLEGHVRIHGTGPGGAAEDLLPLTAGQMRKELGKPGDGITLGEHDIDRDVGPQAREDLAQPRAQNPGQVLALGGVGREHVAHADADHDAVQGLGRTDPEQTAQKGHPQAVGLGRGLAFRV